MLSWLSQELVDDLKVQLSQQQQAANDATQALASRDEELQQIKASSTTEVQAWQVKADQLKQVMPYCAGMMMQCIRFSGLSRCEAALELPGVSGCCAKTKQTMDCADSVL